jgi:uncharacterized protein
MIAQVEQNQNELAALCRKHGVRRLEVFGSAATGEMFDPDRSDLDFLVEFEPDRDLGPWMREYFEFRDELERMFDRSVDLVMTSALKNPRFIREVERTRRLLYAA